MRPNPSTSQNYASPLEVLLSPDGARLYVLCQQSNEVRILNASNFALVKTIVVGRVPRGFSLSSSGNRLYVTNSWDDTISVIDTGTQNRDCNLAGGRGTVKRGCGQGGQSAVCGQSNQ